MKVSSYLQLNGKCAAFNVNDGFIGLSDTPRDEEKKHVCGSPFNYKKISCFL